MSTLTTLVEGALRILFTFFNFAFSTIINLDYDKRANKIRLTIILEVYNNNLFYSDVIKIMFNIVIS